MKFIKNVDDFLPYDRDKIQWIRIAPPEFNEETENADRVKSLALEELYDTFYFSNSYWIQTLSKKLTEDRPLLIYPKDKLKILMLLDHAGIEYSFAYNGDKELIRKSSNKVIFHELMKDKEYVPNTVFSINETDNLTFPVVGKPKTGHSGLGIKKFETKEELLSSEDSFDLFSEAINIVREFRCMYINNSLYMIIERIPNIEKDKNISNKLAKEEVEFVYIEQDINKFPYVFQVNEIVNDFLKEVPLEFFAFDVAVDDKEKLWLIETNTGVGLAANSLGRTYVAIYRDFFKNDPPENKRVIANKVIDVYNIEIKNRFPEEYSKSLCPL